MSADGKVAPILTAPTPALPPPAPVKLRMVQKVVERMQRGVKEVVLCDTKLTDEDVAQLAAEVKKTGEISSLSLFGCQVSESAAKSLANALASHQSLTMLDLGRNKLSASGVEAVCNALIRNSSLKTLGLAGNGMGDSGASPPPGSCRTRVDCLTIPEWTCGV